MTLLTEKQKFIFNEIYSGEGVITSEAFNAEELDQIRSLIKNQWLSRIGDICPEHIGKFEAIEIDEYHTLSHLLDHKHAWPKAERILSDDDVKKIRKTDFFRRLNGIFGQFLITNEEGMRIEEAYWRLVRPDVESDVGPLHADKWFWDLGEVVTPEGYKRIKIWIAIFCEQGKNGFIYCPGSQKAKYGYSAELRDGKKKPVPEFNMSNLDVVAFNSIPGQAIIFHDELIHGGRVGGVKTRVSLEFTMLVSDKLLKVNEEHENASFLGLN